MFALEHMESSTNIKICNQDLVVIQLLHKEPSKVVSKSQVGELML